MVRIERSVSGSLVRLTVEAPKGFQWRASRVHELVAESRGDKGKSAEKDIRERMALGVRPCETPDCEWCE